MKNHIALVVAIASITVINAQRNKKIQGNGNEVTIERSTQEYDEISVGGSFEVELVEGEEGVITLKGEDNILELIKTEVVNGVLTIKKRKNLNLRPSRDIGIYITIPIENIEAIRLSGSGKLHSSMVLKANLFKIRVSGSRNLELTLDTKSVVVTSSGSSNLKLNGYTKKIDINSSGSSNVNAYELEADSIDGTSSGSSNIRVMANESINARVSGSSHVKYKGTPDKIDTKTSGSGRVSKN